MNIADTIYKLSDKGSDYSFTNEQEYLEMRNAILDVLGDNTDIFKDNELNSLLLPKLIEHICIMQAKKNGAIKHPLIVPKLSNEELNRAILLVSISFLQGETI